MLHEQLASVPVATVKELRPDLSGKFVAAQRPQSLFSRSIEQKSIVEVFILYDHKLDCPILTFSSLPSPVLWLPTELSPN